MPMSIVKGASFVQMLDGRLLLFGVRDLVVWRSNNSILAEHGYAIFQLENIVLLKAYFSTRSRQ
jgi:hypothetical protein